MKKLNLWVYALFGVYPISFFDLANSNLSQFTQVLILSIVASLLLITASGFQVLNLISLFVILLVVFAPYIMGKRIK